MTTEQIEAMLAVQETYRKMQEEQVEVLDEGGMGLGSAYGYGERRAEIGRDERQPRYKSTAKPAANKIFHKVPFAKKDEAKAEGMRFDGTAKKWYHSDASKSKTSKFVKEDVDLDEGERAEKKKSLVSMLDRMAKKAAENTKLQKNRAIKKPVFKEEVEELDEKELTPTDVKQKEHIVKGMKKNLQSFKDKYGEKAKGVMYATATNIAKKQPD